MLIAPAPPRVLGQIDDGFAAPDAHLIRIHVQLVREAHGETFRGTGKRLSIAPHLETERLRFGTRGLRSNLDGGDHATLDVILSEAARPHEPRADDCRVVLRDIRDEQRARGPPRNLRGEPATLDARELSTLRVQLRDG